MLTKILKLEIRKFTENDIFGCNFNTCRCIANTTCSASILINEIWSSEPWRVPLKCIANAMTQTNKHIQT